MMPKIDKRLLRTNLTQIIFVGSTQQEQAYQSRDPKFVIQFFQSLGSFFGFFLVLQFLLLALHPVRRRILKRNVKETLL